MDLRWALDRLRRMTAAEMAYRAGQQLRAASERVGLLPARVPSPASAEGKPWLEPLPADFDSADYSRAADCVLQGRLSLLGLDEVPVGFPPQWNRDPKTGTVVPLRFGKSLNYRDQRLVGEVRYLWELNRHRQLLTVAQAWHLSGDRQYALGFRTLLESWWRQCPYLLGPNWISSLELGIRLINWSFAWHLLGGEGSQLFQGNDGRAFRRSWLESVYQHCHFISGHPSLHSSANNHLLGEQVGLFVAATTWPVWPEADRWRREAHLALEREAMLQIAPDGVNREQAIWYQHEVADLMLVAGLVGRANGTEFSAGFWSRFEAMLEFMASIMDGGGHVPALGDADDAEITGLRPGRDGGVYASLLATGAVLFGRGDFKAKAGAFDDKSRWLLGDHAAGVFSTIEPVRHGLPPRRSFRHGGYFVLGSDFETPQEVRIVADTGPLGYLSIAAHGHADALAFTLSVAGEEILIDPGTFVYQGAPKWREYFKGTSAHNTMRIDGRDQSISGGTFLWVSHARVVCERADLDAEPQTLAAWHDGYARGPSSAVHRRVLSYDAAKKRLSVRDEIRSTAEHQLEWYWHVSDRCEVTQERDHALISTRGALVALFWPDGARARLVRGQEDPPLGWISDRFDRKRPCTTIAVDQRSNGNWEGESVIQVLRAGGWRHE